MMDATLNVNRKRAMTGKFHRRVGNFSSAGYGRGHCGLDVFNQQVRPHDWLLGIVHPLKPNEAGTRGKRLARWKTQHETYRRLLEQLEQ